jgi:hypothetical protein
MLDGGHLEQFQKHYDKTCRELGADYNIADGPAQCRIHDLKVRGKLNAQQLGRHDAPSTSNADSSPRSQNMLLGMEVASQRPLEHKCFLLLHSLSLVSSFIRCMRIIHVLYWNTLYPDCY